MRDKWCHGNDMRYVIYESCHIHLPCFVGVTGYNGTTVGENWRRFEMSVFSMAEYDLQPINIDQLYVGRCDGLMERMCMFLCQENCDGFMWKKDGDAAIWPNTLCTHLKSLS